MPGCRSRAVNRERQLGNRVLTEARIMTDGPYAEAIRAFHLMWGAYPGMARLVDKRHTIIAANAAAQAQGLIPGKSCAAAGSRELHKKCRMAITFKTGEGHADRVFDDRIRCWHPVQGYPDLAVNFVVMIPQPEK